MNKINTTSTNLDDLVVGQSNWKEKAQQRKNDKPWLKKSNAIAFMVLDALKSRKMTQVQLSDKLNVSPQQVNKIVKGRENLTLETISKLEKALGIQLLVLHDVVIYDHQEPVSMLNE
jgi:ribosome-binding protein aMBF1 (putative translation factor)